MNDLATALDTIRRAAGLLYQRLEVATDGPWREAVGGIYGAVISDAHPHDDGYGGRLIGESVRPGDREYLVTMQPAVARRLADWLAACADLYGTQLAPWRLRPPPLVHAGLIATALIDASRGAVPGDPLAHLRDAQPAGEPQ